MQRFRRSVAVLPWQKAELERLSLSAEEAASAAWWLEPDGSRLRGHRAIGAALAACGGIWRLLGTLLLVPPPLSWPLACGYVLVARWRRLLPGITPACHKRYAWDSAADRECREPGS